MHEMIKAALVFHAEKNKLDVAQAKEIFRKILQTIKKK